MPPRRPLDEAGTRPEESKDRTIDQSIFTEHQGVGILGELPVSVAVEACRKDEVDTATLYA